MLTRYETPSLVSLDFAVTVSPELLRKGRASACRGLSLDLEQGADRACP
jgi:hypothetical protein